MTFSLNEIDAMGKRAARGAGFSWGLAEEAGKAARWLSACNLPGAECLVEALEMKGVTAYSDLAPTSLEGVWQASDGALCSIVCGALLSDLAEDIAAGKNYTLEQVNKPILLAPFLASVAKQTGKNIKLSWKGAVVLINEYGLCLEGDNVYANTAENVRCGNCEAIAESLKEGVVGRDVQKEAWDQLAEFMTRYLAPETEESRLAGAGAGLNDND